VIKRKSIEIRNITDLNIIYEIKLKIIKSISLKILEESNILKNDPLLLIDNIKVNNNNIGIKLKNKKK
jgi:hypothetical protein